MFAFMMIIFYLAVSTGVCFQMGGQSGWGHKPAFYCLASRGHQKGLQKDENNRVYQYEKKHKIQIFTNLFNLKKKKKTSITG